MVGYTLRGTLWDRPDVSRYRSGAAPEGTGGIPRGGGKVGMRSDGV
jgi:hypothetical protein